MSGLHLPSTPSTEWTPADHGLLAWNYDPGIAGSASLLGTAGTAYLMAMKLPVASLITNVVVWVSNAGASLTVGQCFAGVYSPSGALIGTTADQAAAWQSATLKTMPLVGGPFACSAGLIRVALMANTASTLPGFIRNVSNATQVNVGLAAASSRYGTDSTNTGRTTTLPATVGTIAAAAANIWAAVS